MGKLSFKRQRTTTGKACHMEVLNFSAQVFSPNSTTKREWISICEGVFLFSSLWIVKIPQDSCQCLFLQHGFYSSALSRLPVFDAQSPHTRLFSKQVQQNVPWRLFLVANSARFHPSGFIQRVSEEDDATYRQKQDNIPLLKMGVKPHSKLVGVVETGQKCAVFMPLQPRAQQILPHDRQHAHHTVSGSPEDCKPLQ